MFRLLQISDAHLSARVPEFVANFDRAAETIRARSPDLLVHTGDLSLDGADSEADLRLSAESHAALGVDWVAVPGNHDVGDDPVAGERQPVTAERLARWARLVGPDRFVRDAPGWRLIGLDSQVTSAPGRDAEQAAWLVEALDGADGRAVALFLHKPLHEEEAGEAAETYWCVRPAGRARLLGAMGRHPVSLVASGHLHQWRDRGAGRGPRAVWAPSTAFVVGDTWQRRVGEKRLGLVEHRLHPDGTFESLFVAVPDLVLHDAGEMPELYGPLPRSAA